MKKLKLQWPVVLVWFVLLFVPWAIGLLIFFKHSQYAPLNLPQILVVVASILVWSFLSIGISMLGELIVTTAKSSRQRIHLVVFFVLFTISVVGLLWLTISDNLIAVLLGAVFLTIFSAGAMFWTLLLPLIPVVCVFIGFRYAQEYEQFETLGRMVYMLSLALILIIIVCAAISLVK